MSEVSHFEICKAMADADLGIQIAPLENITDLRKVRAGTKVTIGVPGDVVAAIGIERRYVGGLLLIDREQYAATKKKMEAAGRETDRLLNVARGCLDYGGGYRGDSDIEKAQADAFHHGIQTVINTLEGAVKDPSSLQVRVLQSVGASTANEATARRILDNAASPHLESDTEADRRGVEVLAAMMDRGGAK
jgi:hypothetical protein